MAEDDESMPEWAYPIPGGDGDEEDVNYEELASGEEPSGSDGEPEAGDGSSSDGAPDPAELRAAREGAGLGWQGVAVWVGVPALLAGLAYGIWSSGVVGAAVDSAATSVGMAPEYSEEGVFRAVATTSWEAVGEQQYVRARGRRRAIRDFEWGDARLTVQVRPAGRRRGSGGAVATSNGETTIYLGDKAAVLEFERSGADEKMRAARRAVLDYRRMMRER